MGKFTFPTMLDLEEQDQNLDRGSIVNTILVTPYKCTQRYGTSLGGVSGCVALRSNPDCSVRSSLSTPINAIIAAVMSFDSDLNDALLHSAAYAVLFFLFWNSPLSSHEIKKHNYLCLLSPPPWLLYSVGE